MSKLSTIMSNHSSLYTYDLSFGLHRNYNTFRDFGVTSEEGIFNPTGHVFGIIREMKYILEEDSKSAIFIAQDGHPVERDRIMEEAGLEYKADRPEREYNFYNDVNKLKAILCTIPNVYWCYNEDKESDDEMYAIAKQAEQLPGFTGPIYIYSGDNDLLQAISDRTSIIRHRVNKQFVHIDNYTLMNEEQFTKKFHGVDADHIISFRCICGDPSDKIPGIPRFPRDIAYSIAMNKDWTPITDKEKKWYQVYKDNQDIIERNRKLMQLTSNYEVNITKPVVKKEKLEALLEKLQLYSCIRWFKNEGWL